MLWYFCVRSNLNKRRILRNYITLTLIKIIVILNLASYFIMLLYAFRRLSETIVWCLTAKACATYYRTADALNVSL